MARENGLNVAQKDNKIIDFAHVSDDAFNNVATNKKHFDISKFLEKLFTIVELGKNAERVINPDLDYVVKFPQTLLKKMEEHDVQFLTDKISGDLLPDLYDYTEKGFGGKVRLEIKNRPTEQDLTSLSNSINNLIGQQRYDALVEELQQIHAAVERVERGQDNDRFAKVNAGRKMLLDAVNVQDDELKRAMMLEAVKLLREGRELIETTLMDELNALIEIPDNDFKRMWNCFWHSGYFEEHTGRYQEVQEYFRYYLMSIEPLAYAYTCLNQPQLIEGLLEDSRKVFRHEKIGCLSSVEPLLPDGEYGEMWYKNPRGYEQGLLKSYEMSRDSEGVCIEVNGREILEVLDNGK